MKTNPQRPENPEQEIEKLKSQIRLMAVAIQDGHDRAEAQQRILAQHERRLERLERLASGVNEQN